MNYPEYEKQFQKILKVVKQEKIYHQPTVKDVGSKLQSNNLKYRIFCKHCKNEIKLGEVSKHGKGVCHS